MTVFTAVVFVVIGFFLLYFGGDWIVIGAVRLAARLGVEPVVIGLTIVALGTSLPEFLVSLLSAIQGHSAVAVGNILGSDIFNLCLIVGVSALVANPLQGSKSVARRDMKILILGMILFGMLGRDLLFSHHDGAFLTLFFALYLFVTIKYPASDEVDTEVLDALEDFDEDLDEKEQSTEIVKEHLAREPFLMYLLLGMIALPLGAELLVKGGVFIAMKAGVSQRFIAMTLVSWGTSLPEMATSLSAAYQGHSGLCIGNVVGSNLYNTVCIMGLTSLIVEVPVSRASFGFDFGLACIATLLLAILHRGGRNVGRLGGCILLSCFVAMFVLLSF